MPQVLHVLPPAPALGCPGLDDWIDAGRGFMPKVVTEDASPRWRLFPVVEPPGAPEAWTRFVRWATRRPWHGNGWLETLSRERIGVVHLHDVSEPDELIQAAKRLGIPVVVSWPRGAEPDFPFWEVAAVLASTPPVADRLVEAGCPPKLVRVAPPPLLAARSRRYTPPKGTPLRWVTALLPHERRGLDQVLAAFALYRAEQPGASLRLLTAGDLADEARRRAGEFDGAVEVERVWGAESLRAGLADGHLGVFPLGPVAEADAGLTWPAWVAAACGLPLVLGTEATADGVVDHDQALIAEATPEALARRMAFLSQRPYIWQGLGAQAAAFAGGRLAFDRACDIPLEVYRQVLGASTTNTPVKR